MLPCAKWSSPPGFAIGLRPSAARTSTDVVVLERLRAQQDTSTAARLATSGDSCWPLTAARRGPRRAAIDRGGGAATAMVANLPAAVTGSTARPRPLRDTSDRDHRDWSMLGRG